MYEYTPKRENNKAAHLILLMLVGGFSLFALTTALPALPFRWVFQLIGLGFLGVGIFVYARYVARVFRYAIVKKNDGTLDLTVTECQRKSRITVCRLSLSGIERVEVVKSDERERLKALKKESRAEGRKLFSYTVNLAPSSVCYLFATECGEPLTVVFEPDETFLAMLERE